MSALDVSSEPVDVDRVLAALTTFAGFKLGRHMRKIDRTEASGREPCIADVLEAARAEDLRQSAHRTREVVSELLAFVHDAECECRPETERYAPYTCTRCVLIERTGGAR